MRGMTGLATARQQASCQPRKAALLTAGVVVLTAVVFVLAAGPRHPGPDPAAGRRVGRPPGSLVATSGASFPSGVRHRRTLWGAAAVAFSILMGLSRAYLAAHWLSDAAAGSCSAPPAPW